MFIAETVPRHYHSKGSNGLSEVSLAAIFCSNHYLNLNVMSPGTSHRSVHLFGGNYVQQ